MHEEANFWVFFLRCMETSQFYGLYELIMRNNVDNVFGSVCVLISVCAMRQWMEFSIYIYVG